MKALPAPKAATAPADKGKRVREEFLQEQWTRMNIRVRLTDGRSKGFKYASLADKPRAVEDATAFMDMKRADREAAEREAAAHA